MAGACLQHVYVTELGAGRVVRLTLGEPGRVEVVITGLNEPYGVAVDTDGALFVSEQGQAQRVTRWPRGSLGESGGSDVQLVAGGCGQGSGDGQLNCPAGLALDGRGGLLIADQYNDRVLRWELGGPGMEVVAGGLNTPTGVAVDEDGAVLIAESGASQITRWLPGAKAGVRIAEFGTYGPALSGPCMFAVSSQGLVVADRKNHRALKLLPGNDEVGPVISTTAGGNGCGADPDQLSFPSSVISCNEGHIVADTGNGRVVQWGPGATAACCTLASGLSAPTALAIYEPPIRVVTLHPALPANGVVAVSCTTLGGDSFDIVCEDPGRDVAWLRSAIAAQLGLDPRQLRLVSAAGRLVGTQEQVADLLT